MQWFLVILFLSGMAQREGWGPLPQVDQQTCNESAVRVMAYFDLVELEAIGFCELREALP